MDSNLNNTMVQYGGTPRWNQSLILMQANNPTFKPSPLSFGSPRASPFRRPSTPNSPPSGRPGTPGSSPSRSGYTPMVSPSKLNQSYTAAEEESDRSHTAAQVHKRTASLPTKGARSPGHSSPIMSRPSGTGFVGSDAAAKLPPNVAREIREAFQVLDRDNDGLVNKDDVADVLMNLGQDSSPSTLARFFPSSSSQTINFPTFLNTLSELMAPMSSSQDLLNALAAFDDDDNGQIDVAELRDALLHTVPEDGGRPLTEQQIDEVFSGFIGRRAFGGRPAKTGGASKRGEVFQYHDFVRSVMGGENGNGGRQEAGSAQA
ncbi:Calcium-binding EF-hand [Penicillium atrosanguineum]|nr:Calcium-binding EF-hand [Penicillium atrosanguineum]